MIPPPAQRHFLWLVLICTFVLPQAVVSPIFAAGVIGYVHNVRGIAGISTKERSDSISSMQTDDLITENAKITAFNDARVNIILRDGSMIEIEKNSVFQFSEAKEQEQGSRRFDYKFGLESGKVTIILSQYTHEATLNTEDLQVVAKGNTIMQIAKTESGTSVNSAESTVQVYNELDSIVLSPNDYLIDAIAYQPLKKKEREYAIAVKANARVIDLRSNKGSSIFINLQLHNLTTKINAIRSIGYRVYVDTSIIALSEDVLYFNKRGFSNIDVMLNPNDSIIGAGKPKKFKIYVLPNDRHNFRPAVFYGEIIPPDIEED